MTSQWRLREPVYFGRHPSKNKPTQPVSARHAAVSCWIRINPEQYYPWASAFLVTMNYELLRNCAGKFVNHSGEVGVFFADAAFNSKPDEHLAGGYK